MISDVAGSASSVLGSVVDVSATTLEAELWISYVKGEQENR